MAVLVDFETKSGDAPASNALRSLSIFPSWIAFLARSPAAAINVGADSSDTIATMIDTMRETGYLLVIFPAEFECATL